mmetsp:Transcript_22753/g.49859  ORF Transcript_22753/g.49859 Transcript_22753/m.49859 type:complete len:226 (-) Transcript_22753:470-1147(-)
MRNPLRRASVANISAARFAACCASCASCCRTLANAFSAFPALYMLAICRACFRRSSTKVPRSCRDWIAALGSREAPVLLFFMRGLVTRSSLVSHNFSSSAEQRVRSPSFAFFSPTSSSFSFVARSVVWRSTSCNFGISSSAEGALAFRVATAALSDRWAVKTISSVSSASAVASFPTTFASILGASLPHVLGRKATSNACRSPWLDGSMGGFRQFSRVISRAVLS